MSLDSLNNLKEKRKSAIKDMGNKQIVNYTLYSFLLNIFSDYDHIFYYGDIKPLTLL